MVFKVLLVAGVSYIFSLSITSVVGNLVLFILVAYLYNRLSLVPAWFVGAIIPFTVS